MKGEVSFPFNSSPVSRRTWTSKLFKLLFILTFSWTVFVFTGRYHIQPRLAAQRKQILSHCRYLRTPAGPSSAFKTRTESDRYVLGTKPILLRNAKIWTGARNGTEIVYGDVLLDRGIIKAVGYIPKAIMETAGDVEVIDADGAWVTPGLVDLHSHIGVYSSPALNGA